MTGRIRTIKPEWLDDERLAFLPSPARVLSVALLLLSDDYGRGRAGGKFLTSRVFMGEPKAGDKALADLESIGYVRRYVVRGQTYFQVCNWEKHQRVDKPGKPRVPPPEDAEPPPEKAPRSSYFIRADSTNLVKVGASIDPVRRLTDLAECSPEAMHLMAVTTEAEADLHQEFTEARVHGEWFRATEALVAKMASLSPVYPEPLATSRYEKGKRILAKLPGDDENNPGNPAPDLDLDLDPDHDLPPPANPKKPKRRSPKIPIPDDWAPGPEHAKRASENGLSLSLEATKFRAHAEAQDRRAVRWGAAFTTWLANAVTYRQERGGMAAAVKQDDDLDRRVEKREADFRRSREDDQRKAVPMPLDFMKSIGGGK